MLFYCLDRPRIKIIHNMTSLGLWEKNVPVHLSCSAKCYPPATFFAWYKLEDNTTVLSNNQNYTVLPENPGRYYCYVSNEVGKATSEPVEIYLNRTYQFKLLKLFMTDNLYETFRYSDILSALTQISFLIS